MNRHPSAAQAPTPEAGIALDTVIAHARRRRAVWGPMASTWVPLLASAIIHAGLLAGLGLIVWRVVLDEPFSSPEVRLSFDDAGLGNAATPSPIPLPASTEPPTAGSLSSSPPPSVSKPALAGLVQPAGRADAINTDTDARAEFTAGDPSGAIDTAQAAGPVGALPGLFENDPVAPIGSPGTDAAPLVAGRPVSFGGLGSSSAKSVVYVVDASGPMVTSLPLVVAAVERSVARLSPSQKFGVVLFRTIDSFDENDTPTPTGNPSSPGQSVGTELFTPILVRATPLAKQRLSAWLATIKPMGRSNPLTGLEHALALKPEAVFLLSRSISRTGGGVWDQGLAATLARLDQLNPVSRWSGQRGVVIKTIQFIEEDPSGIMQAIGQEHAPPPASPTSKSDRGYTVVKRAQDL